MYLQCIYFSALRRTRYCRGREWLRQGPCPNLYPPLFFQRRVPAAFIIESAGSASASTASFFISSQDSPQGSYNRKCYDQNQDHVNSIHESVISSSGQFQDSKKPFRSDGRSERKTRRPRTARSQAKPPIYCRVHGAPRQSPPHREYTKESRPKGPQP